MTGKDAPELSGAAALLPAGTRMNVTFLASEDLSLRLAAARAVREAGLRPVPHIAARRLGSASELEQVLTALEAEGLSERVFVIGGDPSTPHGPYGSALDVIRSGILVEHGVREVGIGGYPEGHPDISDELLWTALRKKTEALREQGLATSIITQFGFDEAPILAWLTRVRELGIDVPVRIGVPGPTNVKRLLGFARRFGVASSAGIVRKYGLSMTNLIGNAGPDRLLENLADGYRADVHGDVRVHLYTFGGLEATAQWTRRATGN
jgi:methylenetetrahydrofolate reductase (NADPH)